MGDILVPAIVTDISLSGPLMVNMLLPATNMDMLYQSMADMLHQSMVIFFKLCILNV